MKTKIVHIEQHDDINSLLDKITWSQSDQIILVWPIRKNPINSSLDIKHIQRHAQSRAVQIAFVTRNSNIQELSKKLKISIFPNIRAAQNTSWQISQPPILSNRDQDDRINHLTTLKRKVRSNTLTSSNPSQLTRAITFTVGFLAFFILIIALLPSAEIILSPQTQTQSLIIDATGSQNINNYNLAGDLPVKTISLTVEGRMTAQTTGTIDIPVNFATGTVTFTNLTDQNLTIPLGTILRTLTENPIRFKSIENGELDAEPGATIEIPIEAVNPGTNANLPKESITVIEGDLALSVSVINYQPTSGGSAITSPAPTNEDYNNLQSQLLEDLWQNAIEEAASLYEGNNLILDQFPLTTTILVEGYSPAEPQIANELSLHLQVKFNIRTINQVELVMMSNAILDTNLGSDQQAFPDSLIINHLTQPEINPENDNFEWQIEIIRNIFQNPNLSQLTQNILGKSPHEAKKILSNNNFLSIPPTIYLSPEWWPILPILPVRITFISQ